MISIDFFYIFVGFCVGLLIVNMISSPPKLIMKYPTLENIKDTVYVDDDGKCYKYYAQEISCSTK